MDSHEENFQERLRLYFEGFKHISTLSVAASILIFALYREDYDQFATIVALVALAISLLTSVWGLHVLLDNYDEPSSLVTRFCKRLFGISITAFVNGIYILILVPSSDFLSESVHPLAGLALILVPGMLLLLAYFFYRLRITKKLQFIERELESIERDLDTEQDTLNPVENEIKRVDNELDSIEVEINGSNQRHRWLRSATNRSTERDK